MRSAQPVAVASVLAVLIAGRAAVSLNGYLYTDDFILRYIASSDYPTWNLVTQSYNGHVNPVGWLFLWLLQWAFPGSHAALAIFSLCVWGLTLVLAAWVGFELTDRWIGAALLALIAGLSLFGLEASVWWAAAMYAVPYQFFLVACLLGFVKALKGGSRTWIWFGLLCYVGTVLSYARGFLLALLVFGVVASIPAQGPEPMGHRIAWRWARGYWLAMLGIAALALGFLWRRSGSQLASTEPVELMRQIWNLLTLNVLPALWGGPWRWTPVSLPDGWSPVVANPAPAGWMVWACLIATGFAIGWIWRLRPSLRGWLGWSLAFSAVVLLAGGLARAGNPFASEAYRYTFDLVWPLGLIMVLAAVPLWWQHSQVSLGGSGLIVLICISAVFSAVTPSRLWGSNQARDYMENATAGFSGIPADTRLLPQGVPAALVDPIRISALANSEVVMSPVPGSPQFGDVADGALLGFSPWGVVEEQQVEGPTSVKGPDPDCGYLVSSTPRTVRLDGALIAWAFYARVAYTSGTATTLNLAVGGRITTVPLQAGGPRVVYFPVQGPGEEVLVSLGADDAVACLSEVAIGNRVSPDSGELVPLPPSGLPDDE